MEQRGQVTFTDYLEQTRDEPVYVVLGVQGSGTNLLVRLLTRIFNFSATLDRSLVFNAGARLGRSPSREAVGREVKHVLAHVFPSSLTRKFSKYAIKDNKPFAGLEQALDPSAISSGADLARIVYAYRAYTLGTRRMAIKSDDIWETIDAIDDVLPNRRVIFITRDFRDNLVSITGKDFGPVDPVASAFYVKERLTKYAAEYRRSRPSAYHVKFSTLVESPYTFVDEFSKHFGLAPTVDPQTVIGPFNFRPGKIEKWRALPPQQLAWCEGILYDELVEFGYTPVTPSPQPPDLMAKVQAHGRDAVKRVPQKIRATLERRKK